MVGLVVKQVAIFLIYILIGISFNKAKLLPENSEAVISKLETNLILPIYIFSSLVSKISIKNIVILIHKIGVNPNGFTPLYFSSIIV